MALSNLHKRYILFLCGCIITRAVLAYIAKITPGHILQWFSIPAVMLAMTWLYMFVFNLRRTGPEVFGSAIWWNRLRPVHAIMYILFAYYAWQRSSNAWLFLAIDVVIGFFAFIIYHFWR